MKTLKQDVTKLYSVTEYAKLFGVTRQTVHNWLNDKEKNLKTVTIAGRRYISLS